MTFFLPSLSCYFYYFYFIFIISSRLTANKSNCTVVGKSYSLTAFFKFPITEGKYNPSEIINKSFLDYETEKKNTKKCKVSKSSGETPHKKSYVFIPDVWNHFVDKSMTQTESSTTSCKPKFLFLQRDRLISARN